jgi:hypothetical protein
LVSREFSCKVVIVNIVTCLLTDLAKDPCVALESWMYPFYHSFGKQGRGWLFSILTRAKSTYHATLALSEHYQHRTTLHNRSIANGSDHLRAKGGHYDIALREMQQSLEKSDAWNGPTGLSQSIHVLTCILQLLFSDVREILSFNILDTD